MTTDLARYRDWDDIPDGIMTKTQLARAGLKLSPDQKPVARIFKRQWYYLYERAEATQKRTATPAQLAALDKARATAKANREAEYRAQMIAEYEREEMRCQELHEAIQRDREQASAWAREVLADTTAVILDTETTGLDWKAEIVEIAVIDIHGLPLLNTLVRPTAPIPPDVVEIHGIDADTVAGAPTFADIYGDLVPTASPGRRVVVYNADYDSRLLNQSGRRYYLPDLRPRYECAMHWYAQWCGEYSEYHGDYKWQPLNGGHRALGDCLATLDRLREMAA